MIKASLSAAMISELLANTYPSYQATSPVDLNLGFGFLFYGFARLLRAERVLVIGSKAGFSVLLFALGLKDNSGTAIKNVLCYDTELQHMGRPGRVFFVDPSFSADRSDSGHWYGIGFWDDEDRVRKHWEAFGVSDFVTHYKMTSAAFLTHPDCRDFDLVYIDGDHSREGVLHDFIQYHPKLCENAIVLAHDVDPRLKEMDQETGGYQALSELDRTKYEVCRLAVFPGLAIARRIAPDCVT
jgi:predicted O-methyltransferase YrrM